MYQTRPQDCVLHESGLVRFNDRELITAVPFHDRETGLAARLNYATWKEACLLLGLLPITYGDVTRLAEMVDAGTALCIEPVILPDVEQIAAMPAQRPSETDRDYQIRIRDDMSSLAWAQRHDLKCWSRIEEAGGVDWRNNPIPVMNFGKWFIDGAPAGRAYLRGWWQRKKRAFIQPGATMGPGPHSATGVCDYGTLALGKKRAA